MNIPIDQFIAWVFWQNYAFFCNAEVVSLGDHPYPVMVHMFSDLGGNVGITHIERLEY